MKNNGGASAVAGEGRRGRLLEERRATSRRVELSVFGTQTAARADSKADRRKQSEVKTRVLLVFLICVGTSVLVSLLVTGPGAEWRRGTASSDL